mgnify:FL=1
MAVIGSLPMSFSEVNSKYGTKTAATHFSDGSGGVGGLPGNLSEFVGTDVPEWTIANFTSVTGATRNASHTSNTITPTIPFAPVSVSISGGISGTFSISSGSFSATTRNMATGQNIRAKANASGSYSTASTVTLSGNGDTATYTITTAAAPPPPPPPPGGGNPTPTCLAATEPIYIHTSNSHETVGDLAVGNIVNAFTSPSIIDESNPNWEAWSDDDISDGSNVATTIMRADSFLVGRYLIINEQLKCTEPHMLLVQRGGLWQWIRANGLAVGDNLYGFNETAIPVTSIEAVNEQLAVVDVGAENVDTYYAGKIDGVYILNHNK